MKVTGKVKTDVYKLVVCGKSQYYNLLIENFFFNTTGSKSETENILNTFEGDDNGMPVSSKAPRQEASLKQKIFSIGLKVTTMTCQ